jgi:hypothetical protein
MEKESTGHKYNETLCAIGGKTGWKTYKKSYKWN